MPRLTWCRGRGARRARPARRSHRRWWRRPRTSWRAKQGRKPRRACSTALPAAALPGPLAAWAGAPGRAPWRRSEVTGRDRGLAGRSHAHTSAGWLSPPRLTRVFPRHAAALPPRAAAGIPRRRPFTFVSPQRAPGGQRQRPPRPSRRG